MQKQGSMATTPVKSDPGTWRPHAGRHNRHQTGESEDANMDKYKLIPMPGLQVNHYKGFVIEWIEHREAYRVFRPEKPQNTIGYADCIREAQIRIDEEEWRYTK